MSNSEAVITRLVENIKQGKSYCVLLGAGASFSSWIPLAPGVAKGVVDSIYRHESCELARARAISNEFAKIVEPDNLNELWTKWRAEFGEKVADARKKRLEDYHASRLTETEGSEAYYRNLAASFEYTMYVIDHSGNKAALEILKSALALPWQQPAAGPQLLARMLDHQEQGKLSFPAVVNLNFDEILEDALDREHKQFLWTWQDDVQVWYEALKRWEYDGRRTPLLLKPHGTISDVSSIKASIADVVEERSFRVTLTRDLLINPDYKIDGVIAIGWSCGADDIIPALGHPRPGSDQEMFMVDVKEATSAQQQVLAKWGSATNFIPLPGNGADEFWSEIAKGLSVPNDVESVVSRPSNYQDAILSSSGASKKSHDQEKPMLDLLRTLEKPSQNDWSLEDGNPLRPLSDPRVIDWNERYVPIYMWNKEVADFAFPESGYGVLADLTGKDSQPVKVVVASNTKEIPGRREWTKESETNSLVRMRDYFYSPIHRSKLEDSSAVVGSTFPASAAFGSPAPVPYLAHTRDYTYVHNIGEGLKSLNYTFARDQFPDTDEAELVDSFVENELTVSRESLAKNNVILIGGPDSNRWVIEAAMLLEQQLADRASESDALYRLPIRFWNKHFAGRYRADSDRLWHDLASDVEGESESEDRVWINAWNITQHDLQQREDYGSAMGHTGFLMVTPNPFAIDEDIEPRWLVFLGGLGNTGTMAASLAMRKILSNLENSKPIPYTHVPTTNGHTLRTSCLLVRAKQAVEVDFSSGDPTTYKSAKTVYRPGTGGEAETDQRWEPSYRVIDFEYWHTDAAGKGSWREFNDDEDKSDA